MAKSDKKYYWLRLQKDFFKRHDIRIVESMPNGKDYILFYLKVICESANHGGNLRFSETIPYSEEMLATITNTNVDVVRNAIKIFQELNMIEVLDNGTYFMHEVQNMVGYETEWAIKKREYRKKVNAQNVLQSENNAIKALKGGQYEDNVLNVRTNKGQCPKKEDNVRQEKEIEIEKEIDIEIEKERELETGHPAPAAYGRYHNVILSDTELDGLKTELPGKWEYYIDRLSCHIASSGRKYKSHAATIFKWAQEDAAKKAPKKGIPDYTCKEGESL